MAAFARAGWGWRVRVAVVVVLVAGVAAAGERRTNSRESPRKGNAAAKQEVRTEEEPLRLFAAMDQGQVRVKVVAQGASQCTVYLANLVPKPVDLQLPEVFVAAPARSDSYTQTLGSGFPFHLTGGEYVPAIPADGQPAPEAAPAAPAVAQPVPLGPTRTRPPDPENYVRYGPNLWVPKARAQVGRGVLQPNPAAQAARAMDANRRVGRAPVAQQLSPLPDGLRLRLAPQATLRFELAAVCLEKSKGAPSSNLAYELRPIESFTQKAAVYCICRMLAQGRLRQPAAQIAAWHLTDNASLSGSDQDVREAREAVRQALRGDVSLPTPTSDPGKQDSMSRLYE